GAGRAPSGREALTDESDMGGAHLLGAALDRVREALRSRTEQSAGLADDDAGRERAEQAMNVLHSRALVPEAGCEHRQAGRPLPRRPDVDPVVRELDGRAEHQPDGTERP